MARFITVNNAADHTAIHINVDHIVSVSDDGKGIGTHIVPSTGYAIRAVDTVDEILAMIAAVSR